MYRIATTLASTIRSASSKKQGLNVIIEKSHGDPKVTKDGVTVAKSIKFEEKAKNGLVKQVASATNAAAGDGTTRATVRTRAIFTEGWKAVAAGVNAMDLCSGINMEVVSDLRSRAVMIITPEEITQVATVSANGEHEFGELLARAMDKVGKQGVITVADGNSLDNKLEVVEGYISPYFVTDHKTQKCELEHPLILIHDQNISDMNSLVRILELAVKNSGALLIVTEDVESDALAMLVLAGVKVCAIMAPGFVENRRANLEDLAILTGEVIAEDLGLNLNEVKVDMLGTAKKVTVSLDDTIILHGGGDKKLIEERCEELRTAMEKSTAMSDNEKTQERLSKLFGGVAVFKVGGSSEAEVWERKDRVTDALNATRAAIEEGILPGGGVALLYATKVLKNIQTSNEDQKRGVHMIQNALKGNLSTRKFEDGGAPSTIRPISPFIPRPSSLFMQDRKYSPSRYTAALGVVIVPEDTAVIIEYFKMMKRIIHEPGLHFFIPFVERVAFSQYMGQRYLTVRHSTITKDGFDVFLATTLELKTIDVKLAYHNRKHVFATEKKAIDAMNETISKATMEKIVSDRPQIKLDIMVQLIPALRALGIDCINCHIELVDYIDTKTRFQKLWQGPGQEFIRSMATISFASLVSWLGGLVGSISTGTNGGIGPHPNGSGPNGKGDTRNGKGA